MAPFNISGQYRGQYLNTTLDSVDAVEFFKKISNQNFHLSRDVQSWIDQADKKPLDIDTLKLLNDKISTDFATLYFIDRLYKIKENEKLQMEFEAKMTEYNQNAKSQAGLKSGFSKNVLFCFVPGFAWKSNPINGAAMIRQRELLIKHGANVHFINTNEYGSIEQNAAQITEEMDRLSDKWKKIVIISVSKGSPEVLLALGKLLDKKKQNIVKAWINIGGILKGSYLADEITQFPRIIFSRILYFLKNIPFFLAVNLSKKHLTPLYNECKINQNTFIVNFIGVPLSGTLSKDVKNRFIKLSKTGPNDAMVFLPDIIAENSLTITRLGLDHYYRDPDIDIITLIVSQMIAKRIMSGNITR